MKAFSSWEALVSLLLSVVLLATLTGFSIQEFKTTKTVFRAISADRLLETIEFKNIPPGTQKEAILSVPSGFSNLELFQNSPGWKLTAEFDGSTVSRELSIKPVFDPSNLLEIPGRHRVIVLKEEDSVLIRKI